MSALQQLQELGRKLRTQLTGNNHSRSLAPSAADADEAEQLDLLLKEIRVNEQQLGADHWSSLATAFQGRVDALGVQAEEPAKEFRRPRYKGIASSVLPLGGILALAALVLLQPASSGGPPGQRTSADSSSSVATAPRAVAFSHAVSTSTLPLAKPEPSATAPHDLVVAPPPVVKRAKVQAHERPSQTPTQLPPVGELHVLTPPEAAVTESAPDEHRAPVTPAPTDTFAEQLAALKRADKALKSGNHADARSALAREFSPQLGLHARALRAILACQSGSVNLGKRALADQEARYPNSPYLSRMRRACGVAQ
jgi:hypothetical protein